MKTKFFVRVILLFILLINGCQNYKTNNLVLRSEFPIGHDLNPIPENDDVLAQNDHVAGKGASSKQHVYLDASIAY